MTLARDVVGMEPLATLALGTVAVVVLLAISAFFSSTEIAVFSLDAAWVDREAAAGNDRARRLQTLRTDPHRLLVTILVGNNVVNIAISSIVTVLLVGFLPGDLAAVAATVVVSALVLVCGEIVPKAYGLGNAEEWALRVARPLAVAELLLTPLVFVFDGLTRRLGALLGGDEHIEQPYTGEEEQ